MFNPVVLKHKIDLNSNYNPAKTTKYPNPKKGFFKIINQLNQSIYNN